VDLRFDLHSAKYDAYRKLVRFVAMDGSVRIKCAVTLDALAHVEGRPVPDRTSPTLYKKHVEKLHQIIVRKYRANQFDAFDRIMISPSDIDISRWQSANLVDVESPNLRPMWDRLLALRSSASAAPAPVLSPISRRNFSFADQQYDLTADAPEDFASTALASVLSDAEWLTKKGGAK